MFPFHPFGWSGFSRTCSSLVWKGRSCWGPGIWPARRWAPSGGPRRWPDADWPHIRLQCRNMITFCFFDFYTLYFMFWFLVPSSGQHSVIAEPHPSSWEAGRRPACIAPQGRCRARWEPEPETNSSLFNWFTGSLMKNWLYNFQLFNFFFFCIAPSGTPSVKNVNLLLWPCGFCWTCEVRIGAVCRSVAYADLMTKCRFSLTLTGSSQTSSNLLCKLAGASNGQLANHCQL